MAVSYDFLASSAPISRTLSEQAADQLRQAILHGQLHPGQRVIEQEIAEALALSRGPVRDALRILQNEGLITINPYRGASVAQLTLRDAEEIYSLRETLEVLGLRHAIQYASESQIGELNGVIERMAGHLAGAPLFADLINTDLDFHRTLMRISGHTRVLSAWNALCGQVSLFMLSDGMPKGREMSEIALACHRDLVDEMLRRDLPAAERTLRSHLARGYNAVITSLQRRQESAQEHQVAVTP
ncbi:MAG: GntR family transcriptional regulator [Caldilineaceae bacterium]